MKSLSVTIQKKIAKQRLTVAVYNTVHGGFDISVIWVKSKATDQYISVVFAWLAIVFCIFFPFDLNFTLQTIHIWAGCVKKVYIRWTHMHSLRSKHFCRASRRFEAFFTFWPQSEKFLEETLAAQAAKRRIFPKVNFNKWMKIKNVSEIKVRRSITED